MSAFPETLSRVRYAHRVSQSSLAASARLDHSYISRLEAGDRQPSRTCVERIVDGLRASDAERYALMTSAGFVAEIPIEDDLVALNACLTDEAIDPIYRDAMRNTIRSLIVLAERERERADVPLQLRRVG